MAQDILQKIIDKRKTDIQNHGLEFGFDIPKTRTRKIHPFLAEKGAILEVKRASPSKGDIAPNLDAAKTARSYAEAGAKAISCLTETNYFKGTLRDLMDVCAAVDSFEAETGRTGPAVLRKDFLLSADEVEVAFRAGADAVLLIARILSKETMLSMAKKAESLGISVLIEVRKDEDLEKLEYVSGIVQNDRILCGVNSRDLRDFSIDLLIPAGMLGSIRKINPNARVTFESGILSPQSAAFAGSMGFNAILLGEAAAKNPSNAKEFTAAFEKTGSNKNGAAWLDFASTISEKTKPLVKICGLTNAADAILATELGADFLGFILWEKSKRKIEAEKIRAIKETMKNHFGEKKLPKFVGVLVDFDSDSEKKAFSLIDEGILDFLQIHTFDSAIRFVKNDSLAKYPHYCAVNISSKGDLEKLAELNSLGEPRILIDAQTDGQIGGTGKTLDEVLVFEVKKNNRLWLAGGITPENAKPILEKFTPELIDIASGVEKAPGEKDSEKLKKLFEAIKESK